MDIVLSEKVEHFPPYDALEWTCPPETQNCHIRCFLENDKSFVNIFSDDIDGEYRMNVSPFEPFIYHFNFIF